jgi:basic amino acid/polyamine antiporter, APA family
VMLWTASYDALLTYIGFTLSLSTAATVLGLIRLRLKEKAKLPVPGWPWVPLLFIVAVIWIALFSITRRPAESMLGFATIAIGWAAWLFKRGTRNERVTKHKGNSRQDPRK